METLLNLRFGVLLIAARSQNPRLVAGDPRGDPMAMPVGDPRGLVDEVAGFTREVDVADEAPI